VHLGDERTVVVGDGADDIRVARQRQAVDLDTARVNAARLLAEDPPEGVEAVDVVESGRAEDGVLVS